MKHFSSMAPLIEHILDEAFIQKHCTILKMETIKHFVAFWVKFLSAPIFKFLEHVQAITHPGFNRNSVPIRTIFPTLSAFESLLSVTF